MASPSKRRPQAAAPAQSDERLERIWLRGWRPYAWICGAGLLLYFRALFFGFTYLDDNALILDNYPRLRDLATLVQAFRHDVFFSHGAAAFYRPILTLSLGLDAQLGGVRPFVYHLDNILIHLVATSLVFRLLAALGYARGAALFGALLFDVHPVLSQAVAWVPGRNDSLAAVFVLISFLQFVDVLQSSAGGGGGRNLLLHWASFALALFTKETAAIMILVCLAYALLLAPRSPSRVLAAAAGWLVVLLGWYWLRSLALENPLRMTLAEMARSIWLNLPALLQNFGKILLPFNLSVLPTLHDTTFSYGLIAAPAGLLAVLLAKQKRWRHIAFGLCWFALFLLPSLILHSTTVADFILEHRTYLPMAGLLLVFLETDLTKGGRGLRGAAWSAAVLLAFSAVTWRHIANFRDRLSFWRNAARTSPHLPLAHRNLGAMYYLDGLIEPAEAEYKIAIALNPMEPMVHSNLGLIYMNKNMPAEAEREMRSEIAVNPGYENGYFNLGLLCYRTGRAEEAAALWKRTLELNPEHADANADLAVYYHERKDRAKADFYLARLREINESAYQRLSGALTRKR